MPPEPSVTSASREPLLCTFRYPSALLPKSFERPGPKSVSPAMNCSGVEVVLWWRGIVDMRASLLVLFGQGLCLCFSVRIETRLLALRPGCSLFAAADVPVGTAALQHGAQIHAQLLHRRPAEEPVAVVDLEDTQAGLEYQRVRDHRIVMRVGVFRDVEILLHFAPRVREKRPLGADAIAELVRLEQVVR